MVRSMLTGFLLFLGAAFASFEAGRAAEIPFEFVDGFIVLHAHLDAESKPLNLILDSGAGVSVLSLDVARHFAIPIGAAQGIAGVDADAVGFRIRRVLASVDGVALPPISMAIDLHKADQLCTVPVDGLIGAGFFEDRIVQIDFAARSIRFPAAPAPAGSGELRLPLRVMNGVFCIPVSVNGSRDRWTRLDTGCNDSLHWVVPRAAPVDRVRDVSIGFVTETGDLALSRVRIGSEHMESVETALHPAPLFPGEAGLLGTGILSRYLVTIDGVHREVRLRRR